jgi:hypothetical protein
MEAPSRVAVCSLKVVPRHSAEGGSILTQRYPQLTCEQGRR